MAKHAAAKNLFDRIVSHDASKVEEFLSLGDSILWRELIRYEFNIQSLTNPELLSHNLMLKLIAYDIKTISSLHLAALLGVDDILMSLMEKDVPVDIRILSGTTALHLACFAGKVDTVQLLIQVYKADVHGVDRYGWSALHYACAEGHLKVVEILIGLKLDVNTRDQDGTTPAFRSHVNGHQHVVKYLLQHGSDDDQLNIEDVSETLTEAERISQLYTKVNKLKKKEPQESAVKDAKAGSPSGSALGPESTANGGNLKQDNPLYDVTVSAPGSLNRSVSDDPGSYSTGPKPTKKTVRQNSGISRSKTLPSKYKNNPPPSAEKKETIRRIIRKELELSFGSEYETPVAGSKNTIWEEAELKDIGVKTLTGLMREEFEKYKQEAQPPPLEQAPPTPVKNGDDPAYEDLYASLASLPQAPETPDLNYSKVPAPPLPPRHPSMGSIFADEKPQFIGGHCLTFTAEHSSNPALTESFMRLAPLLGNHWRKLVHVLPLEENPTKVDERITAIEKQAPKSPTDQALRSLTEWRVKRGKEANVDALIIALRKCNMYSLIPEVEKATQEFTA